MKILVHVPQVNYGFLIKEMILASNGRFDVEWSGILYTNASSLYDDLCSLVGEENVCCLQEHLNARMRDGSVSLEDLSGFPGSLYDCLFTSKVSFGHKHLLSRTREYQLKLLEHTYKIYKEFLLKVKPEAVFFPIVEVYDSMVLYYICKELKIAPVIYTHARNFGVSFFSGSIHEDLPSYARSGEIKEADAAKAVEFIRSFREKGRSPSFLPSVLPAEKDVIQVKYLQNRIFNKGVSFIIRNFSRIFPWLRKKRMYEPHLAETYTLIHLLRIQFFPLTLMYRRGKGYLSKFVFDVHSLKGLPDKFVYFPLQVTPETSINTLAPFFVDQLRAIDLVLSALPADHYLVVKEHPSMRGTRDWSFYAELKKRSSLILADYSLPGVEVLKKAALTVSVTGTTCLEAFLLGKPSLQLGRTFFSEWIFQFDSFSGFKEQIRKALESKTVPEERVLDLTARVFAAGDDFLLFCPGDPYYDMKHVLNTPNILRLMNSLVRHIELLRNYGKSE